jgi:hypothetical protein
MHTSLFLEPSNLIQTVNKYTGMMVIGWYDLQSLHFYVHRISKMAPTVRYILTLCTLSKNKFHIDYDN